MCDYLGNIREHAANLISPWLRGLGIAEKRLSFKSWRQTITTLLTRSGVDPDRARFVVGHGPRDIHAKHYLKHPVADLMVAIASIPYPLDEAVAEAADLVNCPAGEIGSRRRVRDPTHVSENRVRKLRIPAGFATQGTLTW